MKRKKKIKRIHVIIQIVCLLAIMAILIFLYYGCQTAKLISCTNHIIQLKFILQAQFKDKGESIQLPYDKDLPGYAVIAKINHGKPGPYVNCNHGAPRTWFGGWQYLNLPNLTLHKLNMEWSKKFPDKRMPVLWCGKGSPSDRSALILINVHKNATGIDFGLGIKYINYKDIESLNECLETIGEKPISFNIPEGIDWSKYLQEIENN